MTDDITPREDDLTDPDKQDPSTDLPEPETGNDDEDDTGEAADTGEEDTEGEADG